MKISEDIGGKVPPQNLEAEEYLLGSLLLDNSLIDSVAGIVSEKDFYKPAHGVIFKHMLLLRDRGDPIDVVTLTESLTTSGEIEIAGGASYIASLADVAPLASHAEDYAKIVKEKSVLRMLIREATRIIDEAYLPEKDIETFFGEVEKRIFEILESGQPETLVPIGDALEEVMTALEELSSSPYARSGIPTGFENLDNIIYGLQPGNFIILAARPSKGKTSFALNIATNVAMLGFPVLFISMEMQIRELVNRMLASLSGVPLDLIIKGLLGKDEMLKLYNSYESLKELDIKFDTSSRTLYDVRAKIRKFVNENYRKYRDKNKLGLVIIDYIQLMTSGSRSERRELDVAEVSRGLKNIASDLNIPVFALSQLNREVEKRERVEPRLSDLRESGALEQDADLIMFIYDPDELKKKKDEDTQKQYRDFQRLIVKVAKQRNGMLGSVEFQFYKRLTLFRELTI